MFVYPHLTIHLDERELRFVLGSGNVNDFINSGVDLYKILPNPEILTSSMNLTLI